MLFKRPKGRGHWLALALLAGALGVAAVGHALYSGRIVVPDRFNPWAPLDTAAEPNFLTGYKLARARSEPARCTAALASTGAAFELLSDRATGNGCGFSNAVRLIGLGEGGPRLGAPLPLSCPMALSLYMWQRHSLQPAAQKYFGARVASVQHFGSYACRNVNTGEGSGPGNDNAPRSRHATADAFDVGGFTLADGHRVSVLRDWGGPGPEALMLAQVHSGACRYFNGVLGPDYNAVHRNHFHLETGGFGMCR